MKDKQGINKRLCFIAFVLSHSRYKFVEWLDRPFRTADVIRMHENAFQYFEGLPIELVYDQDALLAVSENAGDLIMTSEFTKLFSAIKIHTARIDQGIGECSSKKIYTEKEIQLISNGKSVS
ncbi:transposase [Alkalihalobacterium alkalinitrilicum]|uniref:transposase n=1 Tax=Alkalihalobacterium alkalinitrilicum TaxID=427920 RepID=UPI0015D59F83|nr:transposase [Alkalihalobacterium alkalinitrilicum]